MTGLSFDLTEEQEQLRQTVRDFAERECPKDVARRLEAAEEARVVDPPDGHYGEVAAAFVELRPGASLTESEITGHCLERMATFKVPRYVRFVTEWPMSGTKIQKARLRQRIADELAAASVAEAPRLTRPV